MGMLGLRLRVECGPSRTRQSMKAECDINNIMARYKSTGVIGHVNRSGGVFLDVADVGDYRDAVERVRAGDELFARLPAKVRAVFRNDPAALVEALADASRHGELVELGVLKRAEAPPAAAAAAEAGPEASQEA